MFIEKCPWGINWRPECQYDFQAFFWTLSVTHKRLIVSLVNPMFLGLQPAFALTTERVCKPYIGRIRLMLCITQIVETFRPMVNFQLGVFQMETDEESSNKYMVLNFKHYLSPANLKQFFNIDVKSTEPIIQVF